MVRLSRKHFEIRLQRPVLGLSYFTIYIDLLLLCDILFESVIKLDAFPTSEYISTLGDKTMYIPAMGKNT